MDYTPNNIFGKAKELGFSYDPRLVVCFMIFVTSFIISGLFSIGVKVFKDSGRIQQIDVAIVDQSQTKLQPQASLVIDDQTIEPLLDQERSLVAMVRPKDSLSKIFKRSGLSVKDAAAILSLKQAKALKGLCVGKKLNLVIDPTGVKLKKLVYAVDDLNTLTITSNNHSWRAHIKHIEPVSNLRYASAAINGSIYAAARNAGISRKLVAQLVNIFGNKSGFKRMRKGDRFSIFYKEYTANGKKIKEGEIAAAEFVHSGQVYRLIGFTDPNGNTEYYTPEGVGIRPPFVRYPLNYDRVGSRFSSGRYHPILHIVRPHTGVDLTARAGTPIKAVGGGRIDFIGSNGGHGRTVVIKHGNKYSTLYAHLLRFSNKIHSGGYVRQGEIIGYVGSSGLATGPHLHFEFHINGVPHDPLNVKLPEGEMIAPEYRKKFFALAKRMLAQLELHRHDHGMLAMGKPSGSKA